MAEVKLRALGLREVDFGDFDRYLTVLTEDGRKVEILCKNARRGKKQNPAARQFCYSEFVLSERRGRYTLREADFVHSFFPLSQDIERYALACYLAEVAAALTTPDEDNPAICRLLLHALYALEGKKREPALVKAAFECDRAAAGVFLRARGHGGGRKMRPARRRVCAACGFHPARACACDDVRGGQGVRLCADRPGARAVLPHGGGLCAVPPRARV